jgi:hypothetical protein
LAFSSARALALAFSSATLAASLYLAKMNSWRACSSLFALRSASAFLNWASLAFSKSAYR